MDRNDNHDAASTAEPEARPGRSRRWVIASLIVAGAAAVAAGGTAQFAAAAQSMAGYHMSGHAAMDPAEMDRHIGELVDHVLADGTPQQKERFAALIRSAHADIGPWHEQLGQAHERAHDLLMQPHVDRAALEALRVEQVRRLDAMSRRLFQTVGDAADMLTPEQRGRLFEHMQGHMH